MKVKIGSWVLVKGHEGPGKVRNIIGETFFADFLVAEWVEAWLEPIHLSDIERVITVKKDVSDLEKEYLGGEL